MKTKLLLLAGCIALLSAVACNQKENSAPGADVTKTVVSTTHTTHAQSRFISSAYSKNISLDTANRMIRSYLNSVGYPLVDSAIRSLAFNADTLRAYLANPNITSLEFFLAHQQAYLNANAANFGVNIGMRPGALTLICVGVDNDGNVVRNSSNGVYEHAFPCPPGCPSSAEDGFLH